MNRAASLKMHISGNNKEPPSSGKTSPGNFNFTQQIYTQETNYSAQARENAKKFKEIARELISA